MHKPEVVYCVDEHVCNSCTEEILDYINKSIVASVNVKLWDAGNGIIAAVRAGILDSLEEE